jgi:fibronectin-binding autotransporter adhesin
VDFNNFNGTLTGTTMANVNGILGPWATTGAGSAYATATNGVVSAFSGGVPLPIFGAAANVNYTVSASTGLTVGESANTLQFNSGATVSGQTIILNGILNPTTATISSGLTIGGNRELVVSGSGNTTLSGTIANSAGGASALTYNGSGELFLTGANSFTGNVVINSGTVSDNRSENSGSPTVSALGNPQTVGRTVTINSGAILSLDTGGGNDFGNGTTIEQLGLVINQGGTVNITSGNATIGPVTLNGGTLNSTAGAATGNQYGAYGFGSTVTVGGVVPSTISAALANQTFNLTVNGGTGGSYTTFNVANVTGDVGYANSDLNVSAVLGNSQGSQNTSGFIKTGPGTMTLTAANIYTFGTVISNGTLVVNNVNSGGSATGTGTVTVNGGKLGGTGTISGSVVVNSTGHTLPGGGMTTTIGGNLTYNTGGEADFTLANTYSGTNDQIILSGATSTLSGSGVNVGIQLTDLVHTNLDATADYILITNLTGNNIAGVFASTPVWLGGLVPTNAANFSVVTYNNSVVLHYSPIIISSAFATPNPAVHNQLVTVSVTATTTAPGAAVTNITVNTSAVGGSSSLQLFLSSGNTYTNSVVVNPATAPGSLTLTATVLDNAGNTNAIPILLVINPVIEVWNGAGSTNTWATGLNWVSGISPLTGDLLTFTGTTNTTPNMESSYSIGSLIFSNAASFYITNDGTHTLTLTGSVTNNSTNAQFLSVPINLAGVETFNVVSNNLVFSNTISGTGGVIVTGNKTNIFASANSYTGPTTVAGTLLLANGNALSHSTNVTFNSGAKLLLRADTSTVFGMATTTNNAQNASDTLTFDVNTNLGSAIGRTLSVTNALYFPNVSSQTINVTGNTNYTLGLGPISLVTSSHNPYFTINVNTVTNGPQALIAGILTGNWGNYVNFTGGGSATVTGPLSNTSNGSMNLFVTGNSTLTLGPLAGLVKANTGDAFRCDVINGTLVLDNSSALNALTYNSGTGLGNPYFILGAASTIYTISGTITPASGVLTTTTNSFNASVFLGDSNNLTGGLSVPTGITNNVSDGDTGFTNFGVFTIGGQNTSGTNTYNDIIVLGLTANRGKSVTLVAAPGGEVDFAGTILANGTNTTAGVTVGDATHTGTVAFIGSNPNTYAGGTTVTNSILRVDNNSGGGTGTGAVTVNNGGVLGGSGIISSAVTVNSGGATYPGTTNGNTAGVNTTISGNLTYNTGSAAKFNVSGSAGSHDGQITMSPFSILTGTNVTVGINLTSGNTLDTSDYTLISSLGANFAGVFANTPTWLGTIPVNSANYSIVTYSDHVALHYNTAGIIVTGSATPNPSSHGQVVTISVTATAPAGIQSIYVNAYAISAANSSLQLISAGGNLYTNSVIIDPTVGAGVNTLTVTATDNSNNQNLVPILLTTAPVNEVWDGGGSPNTWATGLNWISGLSPAAGDLLTFAGTVQTTVNMESSYTIGSVTFTNGAGSFNITNANNTLTLLGGVTNVSTSVQTLSVPVTLQGPTFFNPSGLATLNAASNNIVFTNSITGTGGVLSTSAAGFTNILAGNNSYSGLTTVKNGVLNLSGSDTLTTGSLLISGGTLLISGAGQLDSGNDSDNITNNGTLNYSGTNAQTFSGFIYGTGGLTVNSPTNTIVTIGNGVGNVPANPYTYTGPTLVNSGELDLNFANEGTSGIYLSSGLTINKGGVVMALGSSALEGYTAQTVNLPITINAGGVLNANNQGIFAAHIYGVLTLNGGTLADIAVPDPTYGGWDINNKVVVNGGTNTSYITDPYCIPGEAGGTVFNVTNGGTASGIDLDIKGSFVGTFTGTADTGVGLTNNGTMAYESTNTYNNATSIGAGATLILNTNALMLASNLAPYVGAITNNGTFVENSVNAQTFLGVISGIGTFNIKNPLASLTLAGASTFAGIVNINNGILLVSNVTGSATGTGTVNVNNGGKLGGHGGSIGGNVIFNTGGEAVFNLDTTPGSANNDQISFTSSASLNPGNGVVAINVLNGSLATSDYVLMNYVPGTISGVFSNAPVWLGTVPGNAANYSIVTLSNTVVLHYATGGFVLQGSASPNPAARNALVTFTVTATGANTITSVFLNASSIGGSSAIAMTPAGGNTWTASVAVSSTTPAGGGVLPFTVQDNMGNTGLSSIALTVLPAVEIWTGGGSANTWVTGANWLSGLGPIYGDILNFAGTTQTNVNMETNYTVGSITFSNNAGSFNITNNGANTLTLNGGVTNNSANPQTLSMTINLNSVQTFNAAAGNIIVSNVITGSGGVNATGTATTTNVLVANNTYTGTTAVNGGTLELLGSETIFGQMSINSGTMLIAGGGLVNGGNFSGNVFDNGTLIYNGTNNQQFTGSVFGNGGFTMGTPTNVTVTFTGTNAFNGNIVINSGIWSDQNNQNGTLNPLTSGLGNTTTVGKTVTINNGGILSVDAGGFLGNGSSDSVLTFIINSNGLMRVTTGNSTMGTLVLNGGTFDAKTSGYSQAFGAMAIGGPITVGGNSPSYITNSYAAAYGLNLAINNLLPSKTITVANVTGDSTYSNVDLYISAPLNDSSGTGNPGNITTVALIKAGPGTMQLSGTNLYSGGNIISAGTIVVANGDNLTAPSLSGATGPGNTGGTGTAGALGKPGVVVTLGDTNTTLNSASPTLIIGGAFFVNHPIVVSTNPTTGTYKIGGSTDNNSSFSNLVTLNQPLTISQVANAGANALTLKGGINSGGGLQTVKFTGPGNMIVTTTGMSDGAGQLAVALTGGTLIVSSTNNYSGGTTVTGGTLGGTGVIAGFATNSAGGNLTPGVGTGSAGTVLTISNLTMLAGSINTFAVAHGNISDKVAAQAVSYGGTLNVTCANAAALAANDTFQLFSANVSYGFSSFANINLPTLSAGLTWNTSNLGANGTIAVAAVVSSPPTLGSVRLSSGSLIMSGSNGVPNATYRILSTNIVTAPIANWPTVFTGQFDANGNYSYTNSPLTNTTSFFRLVTP